jgi:hypothetical protein
MTMTSRKAVAAVAVAAMLFTAACSDDSAGGSDGEPTGQSTASTDQSGDEQAAVNEDQLYFYPPVQGAELTISSEPDGGESSVTVVGVDDSGAGQQVRIKQVFATTEGLEIDAAYTAGNDGSLTLDIEMFLMGMSGMAGMEEVAVDFDGDNMVIPSIEAMEAGETTSGSVTMTMSLEGFNIQNETTFTVSGVGYESVTTALGTFDAYVVPVDMQMESTMVGSTEGEIRYWFVPGFGWVKMQAGLPGMTAVSEVTASTVTP